MISLQENPVSVHQLHSGTAVGPLFHTAVGQIQSQLLHHRIHVFPHLIIPEGAQVCRFRSHHLGKNSYVQSIAAWVDGLRMEVLIADIIANSKNLYHVFSRTFICYFLMYYFIISYLHQ